MPDIDWTYQQLAMKLARDAGFNPNDVLNIFIEPGTVRVEFFLTDENGAKQSVGEDVLTDIKVIPWTQPNPPIPENPDV